MTTEFTVLNIDELTRSSTERGLYKEYRHRIKTKGGVVLAVNIDEEDFSPEKAAPILLLAAQNADKIMKLTG